MNVIAPGKLLVFGGAISSNENAFITTNDTFLVDCEELKWHLLESKFN